MLTYRKRILLYTDAPLYRYPYIGIPLYRILYTWRGTAWLEDRRHDPDIGCARRIGTRSFSGPVVARWDEVTTASSAPVSSCALASLLQCASLSWKWLASNRWVDARDLISLFGSIAVARNFHVRQLEQTNHHCQYVAPTQHIHLLGFSFGFGLNRLWHQSSYNFFYDFGLLTKGVVVAAMVIVMVTVMLMAARLISPHF